MFHKIRSLWRPSSTKDRQPPEKTPLAATLIAAEEPASEVRQKTAPAAGLYARKRRHPRYAVAGKNAHAQLFYTEDIVLLNLSVSGACINTIRELSIGGKYLLRIRDQQQPLSLRCEVVWRHEEDRGQDMLRGYLVGLKFPGIATGDIVRLKDFMRLHGLPDPKPVIDIHAPGALRFHIVTRQHALLSGSDLLDVRKISLGGMLARSGIPLEPDAQFMMQLLLPDGPEPVKVRGRIASVIPRSDHGLQGFDIGVEFLDLKVPETAGIERFIHTL